MPVSIRVISGTKYRPFVYSPAHWEKACAANAGASWAYTPQLVLSALHPADLWGGAAATVAIARALITRPKLLICSRWCWMPVCRNAGARANAGVEARFG